MAGEATDIGDAHRQLRRRASIDDERADPPLLGWVV